MIVSHPTALERSIKMHLARYRVDSLVLSIYWKLSKLGLRGQAHRGHLAYWLGVEYYCSLWRESNCSMMRITIRPLAPHSTFLVNDYAALECSPPLSPAGPSPDGNVAPFQKKAVPPFVNHGQTRRQVQYSS
jgi:hypothetical protein